MAELAIRATANAMVERSSSGFMAALFGEHDRQTPDHGQPASFAPRGQGVTNIRRRFGVSPNGHD
ncbi:MAG TPA: hypothetical protein VK681_23180 [Reyranella sp.]|jgi:hypothetical protein|nr:hypothetical protein [Reyranella sp.]